MRTKLTQLLQSTLVSYFTRVVQYTTVTISLEFSKISPRTNSLYAFFETISSQWDYSAQRGGTLDEEKYREKNEHLISFWWGVI